MHPHTEVCLHQHTHTSLYLIMCTKWQKSISYHLLTWGKQWINFLTKKANINLYTRFTHKPSTNLYSYISMYINYADIKTKLLAHQWKNLLLISKKAHNIWKVTINDHNRDLDNKSLISWFYSLSNFLG